LIGWLIVDSLVDAYELDKVMIINAKTRKEKIRTPLNKIKTIEIRSQIDLISITNILSKLPNREV